MLLISAVFVLSANALEISPKYLVGVWTLENKQNCGVKEFEHLTFKSDGTIHTNRFGNVETTGFWQMTGSFIMLHLVSSPAHFSEDLKDFEGHYDYVQVKVVTMNPKPDTFEAVGSIGNQVKKVALFRCK